MNVHLKYLAAGMYAVTAAGACVALGALVNNTSHWMRTLINSHQLLETFGSQQF